MSAMATAVTFALLPPFAGARERSISCTFTPSFLGGQQDLSSNKCGGAHWKGWHSQPRKWGTAQSTAPEGRVTLELSVTLQTQHWCLPITVGCQTSFCVAFDALSPLAHRNWLLQAVLSGETR